MYDVRTPCCWVLCFLRSFSGVPSSPKICSTSEVLWSHFLLTRRRTCLEFLGKGASSLPIFSVLAYWYNFKLQFSSWGWKIDNDNIKQFSAIGSDVLEVLFFKELSTITRSPTWSGGNMSWLPLLMPWLTYFGNLEKFMVVKFSQILSFLPIAREDFGGIF